MAQREDDFRLEKIVGEYTFKNFWSKVKPEAQRIEDQDLQYKGVDVLIGNFKIDEKLKIWKSVSKGDFLNDTLQSIGFEVDYINRRGQYNIGWLFDKTKITNQIAILSLYSNVSNASQFIDERNINKVNVLLINKQRLLNWIANKTQGRDVLKDARELRDSYPIWELDRKQYRSCHLKYTNGLKERPCNLVIRRDLLINEVNAQEYEFDENTIEKK